MKEQTSNGNELTMAIPRGHNNCLGSVEDWQAVEQAMATFFVGCNGNDYAQAFDALNEFGGVYLGGTSSPQHEAFIGLIDILKGAEKMEKVFVIFAHHQMSTQDSRLTSEQAKAEDEHTTRREWRDRLRSLLTGDMLGW